MTQPPNQPPHGGFGAPQDPPPGGAPQPPAGPPPQTPPPGPPQPGYGYPQAPPPTAAGNPYGQPQQPGPYGQPQQSGPYGQPQQPGPYGQPTQAGPYGQPQQSGPYATQPQYGYAQAPTQPQFGGPGMPSAPSGGDGNPGRRKLIVIVAAAVAALLVAGGVTWAVVGGDDDGGKKEPEAKDKGPKPSVSAPVNPGDGSGDGKEGKEDLNEGRKPGEAKVLWYKEAPKVPGSGGDAPGMWIQGDVAAKAAYKELSAYDVSTGKVAWPTITFPQKICAATQTPSDDGKIVIAFKDGVKSSAKCNQLQVIDLKTGKKGWGKPVKEEGLFDFSMQSSLAFVGDTLMVGRDQSGTALRMSDGKQLFVAEKKDEGGCYPAGFAGGEKLLMKLSCGASTPTEHDELQQLDPKTGKALWTKKFPKGWRIEKLYSVSPTVVYLTNEDKKKWNISVLKPNSDVTRSEVISKDGFAPECGSSILERGLDGCMGVATDDSYLYLPTAEKSGANQVVAFSLATGKEAWRTKSPVEETMLPLKVENGSLIAYVSPAYTSPGRVVSIAASGSHTPKTLLQNPSGTSKIESGFYSKDVDYVDGRFYISTTSITGSSGQQKLMLAYGK
ncbi:PQQ-binding-like beta-propeller repeat protein [Streptomyces sp. NPDC087300]|uniref:outer membrane protein assembly factor BamB family protein n=1 Tax=Streptomyces sp. NPDC087300 TaxID=3365780 RepID=UPI00380CCE7E